MTVTWVKAPTEMKIRASILWANAVDTNAPNFVRLASLSELDFLCDKLMNEYNEGREKLK